MGQITWNKKPEALGPARSSQGDLIYIKMKLMSSKTKWVDPNIIILKHVLSSSIYLSKKWIALIISDVKWHYFFSWVYLFFNIYNSICCFIVLHICRQHSAHRVFRDVFGYVIWSLSGFPNDFRYFQTFQLSLLGVLDFSINNYFSQEDFG